VVLAAGAALVDGMLGGRIKETIFYEYILAVAKNGLISIVLPDLSTASEELTFSQLTSSICDIASAMVISAPIFLAVCLKARV
jgi:hypothetical protein